MHQSYQIQNRPSLSLGTKRKQSRSHGKQNQYQSPFYNYYSQKQHQLVSSIPYHNYHQSSNLNRSRQQYYPSINKQAYYLAQIQDIKKQYSQRLNQAACQIQRLNSLLKKKQKQNQNMLNQITHFRLKNTNPQQLQLKNRISFLVQQNQRINHELQLKNQICNNSLRNNNQSSLFQQKQYQQIINHFKRMQDEKNMQIDLMSKKIQTIESQLSFLKSKYDGLLIQVNNLNIQNTDYQKYLQSFANIKLNKQNKNSAKNSFYLQAHKGKVLNNHY